MTGMIVTVVEPHPDDAFISLGWHLEHIWRDYRREIITVYADSRREREAEAYAQAIGAASTCLGLRESNMASSGGPSVCEPLRTMLEGLYNDEEFRMILLPIGLQHPDHLRVARSRPPMSFRYLDQPYATKQKNQVDLQARCVGMEVVSLQFPGKRKWRHHELFKSQSKFFHFNPLWENRLPEIIVRPCIDFDDNDNGYVEGYK